LFGNQPATNNSLGGLSGLNLYGTQPQQNNQQGGNLLGGLGNLGGGFNITMQTGPQTQQPQQPPVQQPVNTGGFNFLGTTTAPVKTDTSFLGFGTPSSSNSAQIIKGY
jgi:hypothetical protein